MSQNVLKSLLMEAVKEELSISNKVTNEASKIYSEILNKVKEEYASKKESKNGYTILDTYLGSQVFGLKLFARIVLHNFKTKEVYDSLRQTIDCNYASSSTDGKKIAYAWLYFSAISGKIIHNELFDSVQHEIEHIYQAIQGNTNITKLDKYYSIAASNISNTNNESLMHVSRIIYFSKDYEQDGYVNGLYASLMNDNNTYIPTWEDIKQPEAYKSLKMLNNALVFVDNNQDNPSLANILTRFNTTPQALLKYGQTQEKRFLRKIGKVLIKVRQDKAKQSGNHLPTGPGGETLFL